MVSIPVVRVRDSRAPGESAVTVTREKKRRGDSSCSAEVNDSRCRGSGSGATRDTRARVSPPVESVAAERLCSVYLQDFVFPAIRSWPAKRGNRI